MARQKLPRCKCCGKVIHDNPISIVFFTRVGDRFTEVSDNRMYDTINDQFCQDCALAINAVMCGGIFAAGGGGVVLYRE